MNQLILPYQKNTKQTFSNFIRSNKLEDQIINNIKEIFFSSNNQLYLWSNTSCGKSHILYSACNYFGNESKKCVYLPLKELGSYGPDILLGFEQYDLICIDDIDYVFGKSNWELAIFNLINKILDNSHKIIYTSSKSLLEKNISLQDLHSRLSWGLVFKLSSYNDDTKIKILKKIIQENEYNISDDVCSHLLKKETRDLSSLVKHLHKIGLYSLSINKRVSVRQLSEI